MYATNWKDFLELSKVCKIFKKIQGSNRVWYSFMSNTQPKLYKFITKKNKTVKPICINWPEIIKKTPLEINKNMNDLINRLKIIKGQGNTAFKKGEYMEAELQYQKGIEISVEYRMVRDNPIFIQFCKKDMKLELMKIIGIMYLNSSQANLKMESYNEALTTVRLGNKYLSKIMFICEDLDIDFEKEFGTLMKKIDYRFRIAYSNVNPIFRRISYSNRRVEGIQKGSVLIATDTMSGDTFSNSQILIVSYESGAVSQFIFITFYILCFNEIQ